MTPEPMRIYRRLLNIDTVNSTEVQITKATYSALQLLDWLLKRTNVPQKRIDNKARKENGGVKEGKGHQGLTEKAD